MLLYKNFTKPCLDFSVSLCALIILSPVILLIILVLYKLNKGSVFFSQVRPGKNKTPIKILKFKSMTDECDASGNLLPDVMRMTKFGTFIRRNSLDELPQLFNVLKGDMSLIGPRPLLFKYVPLYSEEQDRRHSVKPGITGWAQVNGRNSISWNKKFEYDVYYVDHLSLLLDLKIIWLTIKKVYQKEGVNQSASRPMNPFNGSN
jgi:lipopolysaccharide/colanic/teichoic acid biosynthesis glycosyltransferase